MTNQILLNFDREINSWAAQGSILGFLNRSKIKEFYKINGLKIDTLYKKIETIRRKYLVYEMIDGKERVKFSKPSIIETGSKLFGTKKSTEETPKPLFLPGMKEEDMQIELNELLNTQITINF